MFANRWVSSLTIKQCRPTEYVSVGDISGHNLLFDYGNHMQFDWFLLFNQHKIGYVIGQ